MDDRELENLLRSFEGPEPRHETMDRVLDVARGAREDRKMAAKREPETRDSGHHLAWVRLSLAAAAMLAMMVGAYWLIGGWRQRNHFTSPVTQTPVVVHTGEWQITGKHKAVSVDTGDGSLSAQRAEGGVVVTWRDGSTARLSNGSVFKLAMADMPTEATARLQLFEGRVWFDIRKQLLDRRFVIKTQAAHIKVAGTCFMVEARRKVDDMVRPAYSLTRVVLFTGVLQLINPHGQLGMLAGDVAMATDNTAPQRAVQGLASRFGAHYQPVKFDVTPAIPGYTLPLATDQIGNYAHVLGKLPEKVAIDEDILARNGFTSIAWSSLDDFKTAYKQIRDMDVPVYITSDSMLHLYHVQFEEMLKNIEEAKLIPQMRELTETMVDHLRQKLDSTHSRPGEDEDSVEALRKALAYCAAAYEMLTDCSEEVSALKRCRSDIAKQDATKWVIGNVGEYKDTDEALYGLLTGSPGYEGLRRVGRGNFKAAMLAFLDNLISAKERQSSRLDLPEPVREWVDHDLAAILAHEGYVDSHVFNYAEDFSQYVPRGHYTRSYDLQRYFRAMMWFGRMTFLAKGGHPHGPAAPDYLVSAEEARQQTMAACYLTRALRDLQIGDERALEIWDRIYAITAFFVGMADDLTCSEYDFAFAQVLGPDYRPDMLSDENRYAAIKTELVRLQKPAIYSGIGDCEIIDRVALSGVPSPDKLDKLLSKTQGFRLMGQRFIPDSYAMGRLVFPTVGKYVGGLDKENVSTSGKKGSTMARVFPRGLDVMALLGSKRAAAIMADTGDSEYAGYDEAFGKLAGEFAEISEPEGWNKNLYWSWLYCLKALLVDHPEGYQTYMTTAAWQDKQLNAALASWSQLRHDTLLYGKQSSTPLGMGLYPPEAFPGYVEPVPEVYARLLALTRMTDEALAEMNVSDALDRYTQLRLERLEATLERLLAISIKELRNEPLSSQEQAWIKDFGSKLEPVCNRLAFSAMKTTLIADVHTDQTSRQVLEVGTGPVALIITANRLPNGQIGLAVGPVLTYYEFKHPMRNRLTDERWRFMLREGDDGQASRRPAFVKSYLSTDD